VTCPYCDTTALYEKSAIRNVLGQTGVKTNPAILLAAVIAIAALVAAIIHWSG